MSWLAEPLTTIAFLWRIERRDGVAIGFTSHDRDLVVDGLVHRAAPGMLPSAVVRSDGFDPEGMEATGALSASAIRAEDLGVGRYDGAAVTLMVVDWSDPARRTVLSRGELGAVETVGGRFTAELRGAAAMLERAVVEQTSPECRAELGDRRCRVSMAGRRVRALVEADEDDGWLRVDRAGGWTNGRLRWLKGPGAGTSATIRRAEGTRVMLDEPPGFAVAAGTAVELIEGCDKRLETCAGRFGNAANFRGEPWLPGNDILTRYPGQ